MLRNPLVTVICLCYNHERFLIEALESIKNQTYGEIQIIITDDASQDNSVQLIKHWIKNNDALFIENKTNIGNTKSFNTALQHAKGEYIVDLATDDILLPNFIESLVSKFKTSKYKNLGVVFSNVELIEENGAHKYYLYPINNDFTAKTKPVTGNIYSRLLHSYFLSSASILMKTDVLKLLGGYDENLMYEDVDFWFRSSRIYDYDYVDKVLVKKRVVSDSLGTNFKKKNRRKFGESTYIICKKAFNMNEKKSEHKALQNRVIYELKLALKNRDLVTASHFLSLAFKIQLKITL
ncbi:glycosyltransferase (GT2) [Formosa agariphila KMM 3901]|uniref:Glycosyltransferase (GT2) n=1 Tax=Formosa agariphila (strain DSM 15362 / KCTC 12365 / LMG 23005 / KMM 3901 / M-2Alg 35-1) TaxID=1347342 RepID=T2KMV2_FORAG|nr:glycosyltransferase [Formosa agariphila]CDF80232.1 glycosyltransferase (GT2) [Formosa agariphila KMM 3901]